MGRAGPGRRRARPGAQGRLDQRRVRARGRRAAAVGRPRAPSGCTRDHVDGETRPRCCSNGPGPAPSCGRSLPEEEQDVVVAGLLRRLWVEPPAGHEFRPLAQMCEAVGAGARGATRDARLDPGLARAGLELWRSLPGTADREVLLLTDLHAGQRAGGRAGAVAGDRPQAVRRRPGVRPAAAPAQLPRPAAAPTRPAWPTGWPASARSTPSGSGSGCSRAAWSSPPWWPELGRGGRCALAP